MTRATILALFLFALSLGGELAASARGRGCQITFEGALDHRTRELLESCTKVEGLVSGAKEGDAQLDEGKLRLQKERWINALRFLGFWDARVEVRSAALVRRMALRVTVQTGPRFALSALDFHVNGEPMPRELRALLPPLPCPANTGMILAAIETIVGDFKNRGYPFARVSEREFTLEEGSAELRGKVQIQSGPFCLLGDLRISGLRRVKTKLVRDLMQLQTHEPIDLSLVSKSQRSLEGSGLFSSVAMNLAPQASKSGPQFVDLKVDLREAKPRSMGFGVNFSTQNGAGLIAEWSHRNLRGLGETVTLNTLYSKRRHKTSLLYTQPIDTKRSDFQTKLRLATSVEGDATRSYDATSWYSGAYLDHQIGESLTWSKGVRIEQVATQGALKFRTTTLAEFPLSLTWSNTSELLNPTAGSRFALQVTPCIDLGKERRFFSKQELLLAHYHTAGIVTFAVSAQLANLFGVQWDQIPPSLRYYLGSSSSMRGFSHRSVSPRDEAGKPRGGSSLVAWTFEPRLRIHPRLSLVPFYELGRVFDSRWPKLKERPLRSAGLGAYLFTPIGPLRLDVAFPLDRRPGLDRRFELYMSVGSSF